LELNKENLEDVLFEYLDKIKVLIAPETWENVLLDCTKNELFVLLLLYRREKVNMTQIAEYVNVPLNTATGIIARMEKKDLVRRERSIDDKRIVTICFTQNGREQMGQIWTEFSRYGQQIMKHLSFAEVQLVQRILDKVVIIFQQEMKQDKKVSDKRIRKIPIE
jgi:DNA-binding MarR family transcriptional regulator